MHQITGYRFTGKWVIYSTLYSHGKYASMHDRTGLTDQQAMGKFIVEHSYEVDYLIKRKNDLEKEQHSKIIQINN